MAHPPVLPSAIRNDVGTLVAIISQLNALPACAPVNASMVALRLATHDSGSGWFATPFPYDSFIHNSTPVYPGALRTLLEGDTSTRRSSVPSSYFVLVLSVIRVAGGPESSYALPGCLKIAISTPWNPRGFLPVRLIAIDVRELKRATSKTTTPGDSFLTRGPLWKCPQLTAVSLEFAKLTAPYHATDGAEINYPL